MSDDLTVLHICSDYVGTRLGCGDLLADTKKMDNNKEEPSGGVDMAGHFDRDTKVAYVEQIESGKLTVTEAVKE